MLNEKDLLTLAQGSDQKTLKTWLQEVYKGYHSGQVTPYVCSADNPMKVASAAVIFIDYFKEGKVTAQQFKWLLLTNPFDSEPTKAHFLYSITKPYALSSATDLQQIIKSKEKLINTLNNKLFSDEINDVVLERLHTFLLCNMLSVDDIFELLGYNNNQLSSHSYLLGNVVGFQDSTNSRLAQLLTTMLNTQPTCAYQLLKLMSAVDNSHNSPFFNNSYLRILKPKLGINVFSDAQKNTATNSLNGALPMTIRAIRRLAKRCLEQHFGHEGKPVMPTDIAMLEGLKNLGVGAAYFYLAKHYNNLEKKPDHYDISRELTEAVKLGYKPAEKMLAELKGQKQPLLIELKETAQPATDLNNNNNSTPPQKSTPINETEATRIRQKLIKKLTKRSKAFFTGHAKTSGLLANELSDPTYDAASTLFLLKHVRSTFFTSLKPNNAPTLKKEANKKLLDKREHRKPEGDFLGEINDCINQLTLAK